MGSGRPSGLLWSIIIIIGSLVFLCALIALTLRNPRPFTIPLSAGMATPVPGQIVAQATPIPTREIVVPTRDVGPPPVQPTAAPPVQPTATPVQPVAPIAPGTPEVQPVPGDSISTDGGSIEPFPAGSGGSGASGGGGGRVACNRRVTHVVRSGENLFRIALRYNTTSAAIARLNGITNVRTLRVGQRLVVVTCRGGSSGHTGKYVVQPGDNLFRIALRFGTTAAAIRAVNGLHSNLIRSGQVLRIP